MIENNKLGHMSQKMIVDKVSGKVSEFVVFSNSDLTVSDWTFKPKFSEMVADFSDKPIEHQLKRANKGNPDEGKTPQEGKALRLSVSGDSVIVGVYTQVHGNPWKLSCTHTIDKALFDAYALVVKNDADFAEKEKKNKAPENFSLNLG